MRNRPAISNICRAPPRPFTVVKGQPPFENDTFFPTSADKIVGPACVLVLRFGGLLRPRVWCSPTRCSNGHAHHRRMMFKCHQIIDDRLKLDRPFSTRPDYLADAEFAHATWKESTPPFRLHAVLSLAMDQTGAMMARRVTPASASGRKARGCCHFRGSASARRRRPGAVRPDRRRPAPICRAGRGR